ncbi:hypothetical protein MRB53_041919 [Persea americana]|nr:hypothetical protein MRB53_041919 [Persea americana]
MLRKRTTGQLQKRYSTSAAFPPTSPSSLGQFQSFNQVVVTPWRKRERGACCHLPRTRYILVLAHRSRAQIRAVVLTTRPARQPMKPLVRTGQLARMHNVIRKIVSFATSLSPSTPQAVQDVRRTRASPAGKPAIRYHSSSRAVLRFHFEAGPSPDLEFTMHLLQKTVLLLCAAAASATSLKLKQSIHAALASNTSSTYQTLARNVTAIQPEYYLDRGSQRTELRYGPFLAPSMGSYANANTSLWLHHVLLIDYFQPDTVCGKNYYAKGQRWFASGCVPKQLAFRSRLTWHSNERTIVDFTIGGWVHPARNIAIASLTCRIGKCLSGYYLQSHDFQIMALELMNQQMAPQEAVLKLTMEWIPGPLPADFHSIRPLWLDIAG